MYLLFAYKCILKNHKFTFLSALVYFVSSAYKMFLSFHFAVFNCQTKLQYYPFFEDFQNPSGRINHSLFCDTTLFNMYFCDGTDHVQY